MLKTQNPTAMELFWVVFFFLTLPSVHLDGTVTRVYYKHETEQTMWAKYNCLEQMGVCIFMLGQETSTHLWDRWEPSEHEHCKSICQTVDVLVISAQSKCPNILMSFINISINAVFYINKMIM